MQARGHQQWPARQSVVSGNYVDSALTRLLSWPMLLVMAQQLHNEKQRLYVLDSALAGWTPEPLSFPSAKVSVQAV